MKRKWYRYCTDYESYVVVDDGHTVSTSTISRDDHFRLDKGIGIAVLRAFIGIDNPKFPIAPAVDDKCATGKFWIGVDAVKSLANVVSDLITVNKILLKKERAWDVLDQFSVLVYPQNLS